MKLRRRDFLRGSAAAVAGLALPSASAQEGPSTVSPTDAHEKARAERPQTKRLGALGKRKELLTPYAIFRELQLGQILPEGWLKQELLKQATHLTMPQNDLLSV